MPYCQPESSDPRRRATLRAARLAGYALLAAALILPVLQFQKTTLRNQRRLQRYRDEISRMPESAKAVPPKRPKGHKGAIGRWRYACRQLWAGRNIYAPLGVPGQAHDPADRYTLDPRIYGGPVAMHPNMPFVVMLLTPFANMPIWAMALSFNVLKVLAILTAFLMLVRVANHHRARMGDWVAGLALLWAIKFIVGDIQHGNTNVFVLWGIALHLWLYRRGHDLAAGAALALPICLKMTPALFILYWLYQRGWKVLGGVLVAMFVLAVILPATALGPQRFATLGQAWLKNLIVPGLVEGAWYPAHVNQSLPGVAARYLLEGPSGNIFWDPDDNVYQAQTKFGWITLVALPSATVKMIVRIGQLAIMALLAWAIGWRRLPRTDGRRALHYGLVATAMLLLNQRTWNHHGVVLLTASLAIWYALAYGRMTRPRRLCLLISMFAAGFLIWAPGTTTLHVAAWFADRDRHAGDLWADYAKAYGPTFYHLLVLLVAGVVLSVSLRKTGDPYAPKRQPL